MPSADFLPAPLPPTVVPSPEMATRPTEKIPSFIIDGTRATKKTSFDPAQHVSFQPPEKIYTMEEIGLKGHGISPNAVSEPFPLFTQDAIQQMRAEIFSSEVLENCRYSSAFCDNMVRGMGRSRAPFIYDAWYSPEVIARVSEVAGIELVPAFDYEVANINIWTRDEIVELVSEKHKTSNNDDIPFIGWHFDGYPFVCVTMLSDCAGMVGGETAFKTTTGSIMKVRGPSMGTAVVMQGRYIEHQALKAVGGRERITMVTAFRPRSPSIRDETVLSGSRCISNVSELYSQFTRYRLEVLGERLRLHLKKEQQRELDQRPFDTADTRSFLMEQKLWLDSILAELIEV